MRALALQRGWCSAPTAVPCACKKALYPEGEAVCHTILLHPPAGIAGGDELSIDITASAGSHALLTTPGAAKWYRANGRPAWQRVRIVAGPDARVEWLPQETIFFDATDAHLVHEVDLAPGARYLGCDILCFGRSASGERLARGTVRQHLQLRQAGRLLWWDQGVLHGGSSAMQSPHVLGGATVCATLLAAGRSLRSCARWIRRWVRPRSDPCWCCATWATMPNRRAS